MTASVTPAFRAMTANRTTLLRRDVLGHWQARRGDRLGLKASVRTRAETQARQPGQAGR